MDILGAVDSFLSPEKGYEDAMKQMRKYWEEARGYVKPYSDAGTAQLPFLKKMQAKLADPMGLQNEWISGYETSPYAMDLIKRSNEIGNQQASSMGLLNSSANLENIQRTGSSIVNQDRQQFLDDLMQKYMQAVGIGQNIFNTGANAASGLSTNALNVGRDMSGLQYGATAAPGQLIGQLAGSALSYFNPAAGASFMGKNPVSAAGGAKTI